MASAAAAPPCRRLQVRPAGLASPSPALPQHGSASKDASACADNNTAAAVLGEARGSGGRDDVLLAGGGARAATPCHRTTSPTSPLAGAAAARRPVLQELVATEATFVEALETLVLVFQMPLVAAHVVSLGEAATLFTSQLNVLVNSHKQLLHALEADLTAVAATGGDRAGEAEGDTTEQRREQTWRWREQDGSVESLHARVWVATFRRHAYNVVEGDRAFSRPFSIQCRVPLVPY